MENESKYAMLTEDYGIYGKHYTGSVVELKDNVSHVEGEGLKQEVLTQDGWTTWIPVRILAPCMKPANWDDLLQEAWDNRE